MEDSLEGVVRVGATREAAGLVVLPPPEVALSMSGVRTRGRATVIDKIMG